MASSRASTVMAGRTSDQGWRDCGGGDWTVPGLCTANGTSRCPVTLKMDDIEVELTRGYAVAVTKPTLRERDITTLLKHQLSTLRQCMLGRTERYLF